MGEKPTKLRARLGRNVAFVNGTEELLKTASLFYEYVFTTSSLLSEASIDQIERTNGRLARFVDVFVGRESLQFTQERGDRRNYEDLAEKDGITARWHTLEPSILGIDEDTSRTAFLHEIFYADGRTIRRLTVPPTGQMHDIAYVSELDGTNSDSVVAVFDSFPAIALTNIPLLDVSKSSWDQIGEFRKDKHAMDNMRAFRLFFRENFNGKSLSYIEDKVADLIHKQQLLSAHHGFSLYRGALLDVIRDRTLHAAAVSSITLAISGNDVAALGAGLTTIGVGAGAISVSFSQSLSKKRLEDHMNPVTYLLQLNRSLASRA